MSLCIYCSADLQGRPVCRVCGCSRDLDTESEAKAIRLNSTVAKNLHLPVYEVPLPASPRAPRVVSVGLDLSPIFGKVVAE
jgi:hypothetical protein